MAPSRTRTVKNKHAANGSGVKNSKSQRAGPADGIVKAKSKGQLKKSTTPTSLTQLNKKKKKKVYTEKELGIPQLNMITPVGVEKPKGKKKGKVFVDDRESMNTILAMVQAEKEGQIESKMIKARQMEEIREARRIEAEKKEAERKAKFDETKEGLRKKRKRPANADDEKDDVKGLAVTGSKAVKPKKKVAFAED
ncbi:60S ribosomal subunit assembly/export protein [Coniochaeta pulveracea]|uniref:60S ribosomal subunit assembly/export protein n=1 Tax=Coniochaeta pulveracea TaxID=177199 RepID=A0A420Y3I3_9PEZI|nr:60S ribosomal subunit assembly/export protein [Coniochaeta pulveracea]